ncbi:non-ribosomal peptide synthetase [Micromonospora sp. NPDC007271]|uniref:non-ribosomal peptide synthetase n=1 Tax=Micromonospora sp. NPDC007271 TaxID=3154587 RepID=UPI0033D8093D
MIPGPDNVVSDFFRWARAAPDAAALTDDGGTLSYGELARAAGAVSRYVAGRVAPGQPVSVELARGRQCLVAVLGLLHAGRPVVLADPAMRPHLGAMGQVASLTGDDVTASARHGGDPAGPPAALHPEQLTYVCHTSGSTGAPKWVGVPHRAILHRLRWGQRTYPLDADDRVLWQADPTFDFAWWEMLAPLAYGGRVVIADQFGQRDPRSVADLITRTGVTAAHFVPSVLRAFLRLAPADALAGLRYLFIGGEQFDGDLLDRLRPRTPARIFNQYGPAETCVDSTCFEVDGAEVGSVVPIGSAAPGTGLRFFPAAGRAGDDPDVWELGITGAGLAHGYLGDPRATADRFRPDPEGAPGGRVYRTGDLVRRLPGGSLAFVGRTDDQVKVNGVRVEPEAVRTVVQAACPEAEVAVAAVDDGDGPRLVAFVAGAVPDGEDSTVELVAHRLPRPMVPRVLRVPAIPRLASGKPDLSALLGAYRAGPADPSANDDPGFTPTEAQLAKIWLDLLQVPAVLPQDDFFELGGHSLMATELAAAIEDVFAVEVPLRKIFDCESLSELALLIDETPAG